PLRAPRGRIARQSLTVYMLPCESSRRPATPGFYVKDCPTAASSAARESEPIQPLASIEARLRHGWNRFPEPFLRVVITKDFERTKYLKRASRGQLFYMANSLRYASQGVACTVAPLFAPLSALL